MHHDEIISQLVNKNEKILYVGQPNDVIQHALSPSFFQTISALEIPALNTADLPTDFNTLIFSDILELVDNPRELISKLKWCSNNTLIYEFKHDYLESINPDWKFPWKDVGLENILTWEFDYVRSLYLGYATVYFCNGPNKYSPEELANSLPVKQE